MFSRNFAHLLLVFYPSEYCLVLQNGVLVGVLVIVTVGVFVTVDVCVFVTVLVTVEVGVTV